MKSNKRRHHTSDAKNIIPLLSMSGFILFSNASFAATSTEATLSDNKTEQLPTITISASRSDELSSSAKQVTRLDVPIMDKPYAAVMHSFWSMASR